MISLPLGTKMFQFPRFPSPGLWVQPGDDAGDLRPGAGFPHSEIPGSRPAHGSPRLIAVFHVLHRHLAPRHPPYALSSLTYVMRRNRRSSCAAIRLLRCPAPTGRGRSGGLAAQRRAPASWFPPLGRQALLRNSARQSAGPRGPRARLHAIRYSVPPAVPFRKLFAFSCRSGGDEGTRTPDIRLAKAALSQLSYIPAPSCYWIGLSQWAFQDSNLRPFPYQRNALTN